MARRPQFRPASISGVTTGYRPAASRGFRIGALPWPIISSIVALTAIGWFVFGSGRFTVRSIILAGSVNDGVNQALQMLKGKNILLLSTAGLERTLPQQQSSIRALHIIKGFPDTLRVDVAVRQPLVRWKTGDQELYLDQAGVLFSLDPKPASSVTDPLPLVTDPHGQPPTLGQPFVPPSFVAFVVDLQGKFHDRTGVNLADLAVGETTREVDGTTNNHVRIRFDTTRALDPQLTTLASVITTYGSSIRESIDLRVEGRVFYK